MAVELMNFDKALEEAQRKSLADVIRAKSGTSAKMDWPEGFKAAVNAISSGGGAPSGVSPFSRIEIKTWTPKVDTLYYHIDNTENLSAVFLFCMGNQVGASGIHALSCVTDPKYKMDQYDNPVGSWSGKSYGVSSGLAAYNYPNAGDIGDDSSSTYFVTNAEYLVILAYGPL